MRRGPFGRAGVAAVRPKHVALQLVEAHAVRGDERAVHQVFGDQHVQHGQHQGRIGSRAAGQPPGGQVPDGGRAARVNHDDLRAAPSGFDQALRHLGALARFEHIGAPQDDHLGVLHGGGVEAGGSPLLAQHIGQDELAAPLL